MITWTGIDLTIARVVAKEMGLVKWDASDTRVKAIMDAQEAAVQADFVARVADLTATGLEAYLLKHHFESDDSRKWAEEKLKAAEEKLEGATMGVKGFSVVLGGVVGFLGIFGVTSIADLHSGTKELESVKDKYQTEVDGVKASKSFLQQELSKVRQRSNRLLEVMQRIKNEEFERSFYDLYAVLPFRSGAYADLDSWLAARVSNMLQIEQFLALEKVSQNIEREIASQSKKPGNAADTESKETAGSSAVDLDTYRSLINFRALRLQHRLFELLSLWAEAEKNIARAPESEKFITINRELKMVEERWQKFEPKAYLGETKRRFWEETVKSKPDRLATPEDRDQRYLAERNIGESEVSLRQDDELFDLVTQAAILKGIVRCNLKTKLFNADLDQAPPAADRTTNSDAYRNSLLAKKQADIEALAGETEDIWRRGYVRGSADYGAGLSAHGMDVLRGRSAQQRKTSELYCIQFYQNVVAATRALPTSLDTPAPPEQNKKLADAIDAMTVAGRELSGKNLQELETYHENVMANFLLWQSIAYSRANDPDQASKTLEVAVDSLKRGLSLSPARETVTRGSRNTLLQLTSAEVQIARLRLQLAKIGPLEPAAAVAVAFKGEGSPHEQNFEDILDLFRGLIGSEVDREYLRDRTVKNVPLRYFSWFYDLARELKKERIFDRLNIKPDASPAAQSPAKP